MKLEATIECTPLSVNAAWQGRRYKTKAYQAYEMEVFALIPSHLRGAAIEGLVQIEYRFHLKHHKTTDYDNLLKPLQDILVKCGVIKDDRFIYKAIIEKIPATDGDKVEILVSEYKI